MPPLLQAARPVTKRRLEDLGVFGGTPAFPSAVHVGRPGPFDRERLFARIDGMLARGRYTNNGPLVRELESRVAALAGVAHCVATCNATTALQIVARALELHGEVIVPSLTFVATAHALRWLGIRPRFCDVDRTTHNLDPQAVERAITSDTTAIVGVHLWGRPCDTEALAKIARRHGLRLLFDAAHAFGCTHGGHPIGRFGDAEVFSFHATKVIHAFEGGAIVTDDDELARRSKLMRNFGFAGYDRVHSIGINGKMSEVAAAMGLTALDGLDEAIAVNRRNDRLYRRGLSRLDGARLVSHDGPDDRNYQYVILEVDEEIAGIERDSVVALLHAENVLARRYFYPGCHRMAPYRDDPRECDVELPATEQLTRRLIALPTGPSVAPEDVEAIAALLRFAFEHGPSIDRRMRGESVA